MNYEVDINGLVDKLGEKIKSLEIENAKLATLIEQFQAEIQKLQDELAKGDE